MKTIGIIGGLGPETTVDYYKEIILHCNHINKKGNFDFPEIIIYSINLGKMLDMFNKEQYDDATAYLVKSIGKLEIAGADFAVLSANTPHLLFDQVQLQVKIPLVSIVEACASKAREVEVKSCALLGTKYTMANDFYAKVFNRYNMDIVVPNNDQIEFINSKLFNEMELGIYNEDTKYKFLDIVSGLKSGYNIEAVILGCTELQNLFRDKEYLELPFFNTTHIHVEAIIDTCLKD